VQRGARDRRSGNESVPPTPFRIGPAPPHWSKLPSDGVADLCHRESRRAPRPRRCAAQSERTRVQRGGERDGLSEILLADQLHHVQLAAHLKGTVENAIQHTQSTALKGRRFASIEEQNEFLENWETKWAAQRIHGSTRRQVEAMFQEERPFLKPLPVQSFQYFTEGSYTVGDDTCVRVDFSSYAARPAAIGSRVLVRLFDHHLEIRDLMTKSLLRTHTRSTKPGNVALPDAERLFNPSRETRRILAQARAIGPATEQLCQSLFDSEGRVGQRKMWGIVGLARHNPRRLIDRACAMALQDGVRSYKQIRALTERLFSEALADLNEPVQGELAFTQDDPLIRSGGDYADLFNLGAQASAALPPTLKEPAP